MKYLILFFLMLSAAATAHAGETGDATPEEPKAEAKAASGPLMPCCAAKADAKAEKPKSDSEASEKVEAAKE